jgi:alkyl hydroperoxide reductase subunit AhpF
MMTDTLLDDTLRHELKEIFDQQIKQPVRMMYFGAELGCDYCEDTLRLSREVCALSDQIHLSVHDLDLDAELASRHGVDKAPTLVIAGQVGEQVIDFGIRFAGIPAGHEFISFVQAIVNVSGRESPLAEETRQFLHELAEPVHLQVFVTPT